jgi:hypothetical protein
MSENRPDPETVQQKAIFLDTNILVPQSHWDFYKDELNQFKPPKNGSGQPYLENITSLNEGNIERVINDAEGVRKLVDSIEDRMLVTNGVHNQSISIIDNTLNNIQKRREEYIFIQFNQLIPEAARKKTAYLYGKLIEYAGLLSRLKTDIRSHEYTYEPEELYFQLMSFVRTLRDKLEVGKADHPYDHYTDEEINICSLFYTLSNYGEAEIITNDGDVLDLISASGAVLENMREIISTNPRFNYLLAHMPKAYKIPSPESAETQEIDTRQRGSMIVKGFGDYKANVLMDDMQKREYFARLNQFKRFLDFSMTSLMNSVDK